MSLDPTVVALIGTVFGGVGLKILEWWLGKGRVRIDDATTIRNELRSEVTVLRAENNQLESEVDEWREKYYRTYERLIKLKSWTITHGLDPPDDE